MPRGRHPNSLKALEEHRRKFTTETSRECTRRRVEKQQAEKAVIRSFSELAKAKLTNEEKIAMLDGLEDQVKKGVIPAWVLFLKLIGEDIDRDAGMDESVRITIDGGDEYAD